MGNSLTTLWSGLERDVETLSSAFTNLDCFQGSAEVRILRSGFDRVGANLRKLGIPCD